MSIKVKPRPVTENPVAGMVEDRVRININMPSSKRQALKVKAAQERKTINELVNAWVDEYLSQ